MVNIVTCHTQEYGYDVREQLCPSGFVIVDVFVPHSTPWDYHGRKHQRQLSSVLKNAGLNPVSLETEKTILNPIGSGRNGMVRFGDNMTCGVFKIAVPVEQEHSAKQAIERHNEAIHNWLHCGGEMPSVLRY